MAEREPLSGRLTRNTLEEEMDYGTLVRSIPFVVGTIAAAVLATRAHRNGAPVRLAAGGGLLALSGMTLAFLAIVQIFRTTFAIRYDFRFYSLILVGVIILVQSLRCVHAAPCVAAGRRRARRDAWRATAILTALTVPLIPLRSEAKLYAAVLAVNGIALALAHVRARETQSKGERFGRIVAVTE